MGGNATHMVAKNLDAVNGTACRRSELVQVRTLSTFAAHHQNAGFGRPTDQDEARAAVLFQGALISPPRARRC
jgi:hypothetical protein